MYEVVVCMVMLTSLLPVSVIAGSEEDPEIIDTLNDQFGALVDFPTRIRSRIALSLLQMDSFDFIDIDSAWLYEHASESDYMFAALKLKDLDTKNQRAIYTIHWQFNGVPYCVWSHLCNNGQNYSCSVGVDKRFNFNYHDAEVAYDFESDIVTFKFKKEFIGNPQPGEVLSKTFAWTALRFNNEPLCLLFSDGELVKDAAPFIENSQDFGREYIVQY